MLPTTHDPNQSAGRRQEITPTQLFTAFSHRRRQLTLAYLVHQPAAIAVGDLAEYIAVTEGEPSREWYQRVLTDLAHCHLPHLHTVGLVHVDDEAETVELVVNHRVVAPYLELAGHADA